MGWLTRPFGQNTTAVARTAGTLAHRTLDDGYQHGPPRPDHMDNGIGVQNLSVRLGGRVALRDVTGTFAPGSLTAVVGPNGAGKSTLLHALAGLTRPYRGTIACPARDRHRLGYLPQRTDPDPDYPMTVSELAALGLWRHLGAFRSPPPAAADRIAEALDATGLTSAANQRIGALSVGQQRRAYFAQLILLDPETVLLDEPFAAVDAGTAETLLTLAARWHQRGRTVIAVVHDIEQARRHFPSCLVLARNPIAWGNTADVLTDANLARALSAT